jgi:hypothetical protein
VAAAAATELAGAEGGAEREVDDEAAVAPLLRALALLLDALALEALEVLDRGSGLGGGLRLVAADRRGDEGGFGGRRRRRTVG